MKTLRLLLFGFITLAVITNAQTVIPPGNVSGTWTLGGSPYEIQGEITIPNGLTLTIEPGVLVEFQGHYKLNVQGRLLAVGTETDTITFTINDTTCFSIPDTSLGGWHGIKFDHTSVMNDSSKIIYCKLQYGKATGTGWSEKSGGAIYIDSFDKLLISNCLVFNNRAGDSGGGISASLCNLQIDNCTFKENRAVTTIGRGGAISCDANTYTGSPYQVKITNCKFIENAATAIGGVYSNNWAPTPLIIDVTIDNCEFLDNISDHYGGLYVWDCSISMTNCVFTGNTAISYTAGAGFGAGSIGFVSNCLFASNVANTGGGNWNSGGVTVWGGSNINFINCTFADNLAYYGAGLTVSYAGIATTTNCIFWGNSTDQIALDTYNNEGGTLFVNYCDVEGGEASVNIVDSSICALNWGDGNIDADPLFENSSTEDYHLQNSSPCIGTGIDSTEINGSMCYCPLFDIEGNPRPNPPGSMPDIGAYESPLAVSGIEENDPKYPTNYALYQNYPNPFNPLTTIKYQITELSFVTLKIFDVLGNEIKTLVNEEKLVGNYEVDFDAGILPSGVYFYRLQAGSFVNTKKMVLMK